MHLESISQVNAITKQIIVSRIIAINNFIALLAISFLEACKIIFNEVLKGRLYFDNFFDNLRKIIWTCLPIATLTISASSIVYSIHVAPAFSSRGLSSYLGGIVALAIIRESAPVMGSLAIVTQYCTGMTAMIGSMKITEQIDAMKMAKVNPVAYLLVPMLLAGLIGFPIVIAMCMFLGILITYISSTFLIHISFHLFISSILKAVVLKDILLALVKASFFGFFVTLVSFTSGMQTVGGSKALGQATRLSVVTNFALVVILDYIITALWL